MSKFKQPFLIPPEEVIDNHDYSIDFRKVVDLEKDKLQGEVPLIDRLSQEAYIVEFNAAVARLCERIVIHDSLMNRVYTDQGRQLLINLAYWIELDSLEKMKLRGCSAVSIEEFIFALDVIKFFYDFDNEINDTFMSDLLTVFIAMKNSIKDVELPEFTEETLWENIEKLQQFLKDNLNNETFKKNFSVYRDTWFKKCKEMAQVVAFLSENNHILGLRPGSIRKSKHNGVTEYEGTKLNALIGHGFVDFFGADLGEKLSEDSDLRDQEIIRRLKLARDIRLQCYSTLKEERNSSWYKSNSKEGNVEEYGAYDIVILIKAALSKIKLRPLRFYLGEFKVLNDLPSEREMRDYMAQIRGYIDKLMTVLSSDPDLSKDGKVNKDIIDIIHGLIIVLPEKMIIKGDISENIFQTRLKEIIRGMHSAATLDNDHFPKERSSEDSQGLNAFEERWITFQNTEISKMHYNSLLHDYISQYLKSLEEIIPEEVTNIAEGYYITCEQGRTYKIYDPWTCDLLANIRERLGLDVIEIDQGFLYVRNNGIIWINEGWSDETKRLAQKRGFNVQDAPYPVMPPKHITSQWELKFCIPRPGDSLLDLFSSKSNISEYSDIMEVDIERELLFDDIERNSTYQHGKLNLKKSRKLLRKHRTLIKTQIEVSKTGIPLQELAPLTYYQLRLLDSPERKLNYYQLEQ